MSESSPELVRVSLGSAIVLGLTDGFINAKPTTVYLLTYNPEKCSANCAFCPQASRSSGRADMLSRVIWPTFRTLKVTERIESAYRRGDIRRVCIQALNYRGVFGDVSSLVRGIKSRINIPISISCQPLRKEEMEILAELGVERVSIALDACTEYLFRRFKGEMNDGPYVWESHIKALMDAVEVFGRGNVTTHLIIGLGESEEEAVKIIQWCVDRGVYPSLFAFTPIKGTLLGDRRRPSIESYRRIQIAHYLITHSISNHKRMRFDSGVLIDFGVERDELIRIIETGEPFRTTGCPGCNRPYYNEEPRGPLYNYPMKPGRVDIEEIKRQIRI